jgi:hypothetical protein
MASKPQLGGRADLPASSGARWCLIRHPDTPATTAGGIGVSANTVTLFGYCAGNFSLAQVRSAAAGVAVEQQALSPNGGEMIHGGE